jgi:hypothetical protein
MKPSHQLIAAAALCALASAASAKVIASALGPNFFNYASSGTYVPISGSSTTLVVNASKAGLYVITYSAECSVQEPAGNSYDAYVEIDMEVNGLAVAATAGDFDIFCGADGVADFSGFTHPSVTMVAQLNAGPNNVRVLGKFHGGATAGWISSSSLVVQQ